MQCGRVSRPYNCIKTEGLGVRAKVYFSNTLLNSRS
jgi:hypothetical protein